MSGRAVFPGGKSKAVTLSYDDNMLQDERLLEICKKYGLRITFNINSGIFLPPWIRISRIYRILSKKKARLIFDSDICEIASHGYFHKNLAKMSARGAAKNVSRDVKSLERIFNRNIIGHAYPMGEYNGDVKSVLRQNGIHYARTVKSTHAFDLPEDWYEWHPTCHHGDAEVFDDIARFLQDDDASLFFLWGHAFEFDINDDWDWIEKIASELGGRDDIWYCTNGELYSWLSEHK